MMACFTQIFTTILAISTTLAAPLNNVPTTPHRDIDVVRDVPDFELGRNVLARRQDYTQNYKTGGTINFTPGTDSYSVNFSGAGDFVVGRGWKTGTRRTITLSGSTNATAGTVLVSVYGWSKDPLIEYYVQEYSNGNGAAQGTKAGTCTSDGATYDIWKHQQVNQPSITGTATFWQYISVRQSGSPNGGTVNVGNHFDCWEKANLTIGSTLDYQVVATEGWGNAAGSSQYTVSGS